MNENELLMVYGSDIGAIARRLLEEADLAGIIGDKSRKIGIKPNLVSPSPAENGATTHPEVVAAVAAYLRENGFTDVILIEGSGVGKSTARAIEACGYADILEQYGIEFVDTKKDSYVKVQSGGREFEISRRAAELDFIINLPVLKGHCQTLLTCALKNLKGLLSDGEKRRFHGEGLHRPIALLNTVLKSDFILVDAVCGDLDYEEGGNPVDMGMLVAARDPVLCDAFAAGRMGYVPADIGYIPIAERLGVGSSDLASASVRELNHSREGKQAVQPTGKAQRLAAYTQPESACSTCYAALIRALSHLSGKELSRLEPVCIGQGYEGKKGSLGVGRCTTGFAHTVPGCPPSAAAILELLKTL